jgi:hypothetical protein
MDAAQAAMQIGQNVGQILIAAQVVPAIVAAPVVAILGWGCWLLGAKYERRWGRQNQREPVLIEDLTKILLPTTEEEVLQPEEGEQNNAQ